MTEYTVGEIAKALGISPQTLRHYEEVGLITSKRNDENQYRTYSTDDTKTLFQIYIYRSMGFSLKEISSMLKSNSYQEVLPFMDKRLEEVNKQIKELEELKKELMDYRTNIELANTHINSHQILNSKVTLYALLKSGSGYTIANKEDAKLIEFQKYAPHVRQCFYIDINQNQNEFFEFQYGVSINKEWVEENLDLNDMKPYKLTIEAPIAKTYIYLENERFSQETFSPFINWIKEQGYTPSNKLYGIAHYSATNPSEICVFEFMCEIQKQEQ